MEKITTRTRSLGIGWSTKADDVLRGRVPGEQTTGTVKTIRAELDTIARTGVNAVVALYYRGRVIATGRDVFYLIQELEIDGNVSVPARAGEA